MPDRFIYISRALNRYVVRYHIISFTQFNPPNLLQIRSTWYYFRINQKILSYLFFGKYLRYLPILSNSVSYYSNFVLRYLIPSFLISNWMATSLHNLLNSNFPYQMECILIWTNRVFESSLGVERRDCCERKWTLNYLDQTVVQYFDISFSHPTNFWDVDF